MFLINKNITGYMYVEFMEQDFSNNATLLLIHVLLYSKINIVTLNYT